jgi:hypothetical protein
VKTLEEVKAHCRFVGEGIEQLVADGEDLFARFEGTPVLRFKVEKDGNAETIVGGELGGDDSGIVVSESGVTKVWNDEVAGYAFNPETRAAMVEFFAACNNA